jgi:hypothetical protein
VDIRRVSRVAVGICVATLAVTAGVLFGAGINQNAQIVALRNHGVPADVTVTTCLGLLGGSGSNAAGYSCRGTLVVGGRRYDVAVPGSVLRAPGSNVRVVFVLPTVLLLVVMLVVAGLVLRRRHARGTARPTTAGIQPARRSRWGLRFDRRLGGAARGV